MRNYKKPVIKQTITSIIDSKTGEELKSINEKNIYVDNAESFVKVYLDNPVNDSGGTITISPLLVYLLKIIEYAKPDVESKGGQRIIINRALKKDIAAKIGLTISAVEKQLNTMVDKKILLRLDRGCYQLNPYIISKGDAKAVRASRILFNINKEKLVKCKQKNITYCA